MQKTNKEYSLLYDFYGELLSERQREVFELYYEENLSLSEIAENVGVSRQAVHISAGKANRALENFEEKLGLIRKHESNERALKEAEAIIDAIMKDRDRMFEIGEETAKDLKRIRKLMKGIEI